MNFAFKMMDFVFKMMIFGRGSSHAAASEKAISGLSKEEKAISGLSKEVQLLKEQQKVREGWLDFLLKNLHFLLRNGF